MTASPADATSSASGAPESPVSERARSGGAVRTLSELSKARLTALVLATTAAGYAVATPFAVDWATLGWTVLGTGLAAASASMLNQLAEITRDARMHRTRNRPLPAGRVGRVPVFIGGVLLGYLGVATLVQFTTMLAAGLALANLLLYVLVYTPLKPRTTFNTLVGAVTGALPPMIGWAAATDALPAAAWLLGAILFVWQLPHFLSLAWMYREDYDRGGFRMLPAVDRGGEITSLVVLAGSLLLVPLGLLGVRMGLAGWWYGAISVPLAAWMTVESWRLYRTRSLADARRVFLASLAYLPLLMIAMVLDRGPISPRAWLDGGRELAVEIDAQSGRMFLPSPESIQDAGEKPSP
ncbi:MAG: heme o synthase [Phycisphaerales bacterium]